MVLSGEYEKTGPMNTYLDDLLKRVPVAISPLNAANPLITGVTDDSRRVQRGNLFVARTGTSQAGSRFIPQAIEKGAAAILTDQWPGGEPPTGVAVLITAEIARAAGELAHGYYSFPARDMTVMAVTGTNGKTTIAYLTRAIFAAAVRRCGLIGTVEIDDGANCVESPMTTPGAAELAALLGRMRDNGLQAVAMEASSHALEQDRLAGLRVQVAMFSNLTRDHLDYHKTMESYAAAKARLFTGLDADAWAVINLDDPYARKMVSHCPARLMTYAIAQPADVRGTITRMDLTGMRLNIDLADGRRLVVDSPLVGAYNAQNILCAMAGGLAAGLPAEVIANAFRDAPAVPGRLQRVVLPGHAAADIPINVFVDYAHTPDALENVLRMLGSLPRRRVICVFGCGGDRDRTKRPLMGKVARDLADHVIITSDNPRTEDPMDIIGEIVAGFGGEVTFNVRTIVDRKAAIYAAVEMAQPGDTILLAGKGHENYQIIGAVRHHFDDVEQAAAAMQARFEPASARG